MLALDHGLLHNIEINANFNFFFTTSGSFLRCQVSEGVRTGKSEWGIALCFFVKPT
jgi:hypothetical protein